MNLFRLPCDLQNPDTARARLIDPARIPARPMIEPIHMPV